MPEGDTIHKLAAALSALLRGATVRRARLRRLSAESLAGLQVHSVESHGKHLYIGLEKGLVLRSHLGLYGSWHSYAPGEAWRKPIRQASVVIDIGTRVLVCFNAKEVELLEEGGWRLADGRRRLGPDLTRPTPDGRLLVARARQLLAPTTPLVDVLLDQRVASGIGNVYKCEVLFLAGRPPLQRLGEIRDQDLAELYRLAAELLGRNLRGGPRVTRFMDDGRGPLWVYGRADEPCLRCAAAVRREALGENPRSTYWCPTCQAG